MISRTNPLFYYPEAKKGEPNNSLGGYKKGGYAMKTRILLLPILSILLTPVLLGGCYTMISQTVYERPEVQRPERAVIIERPAPVREVNSSQQDSVAAETDQQVLDAQKDAAAQNYADQYDNRPNEFNNSYGWPEPYLYDSWRYPPGWYGSYIWDPYIFTPHLHFGLMFNTRDPFYWHDPWTFGYNSWYYDSWYSPYYAMYDPWYNNYYDPYYYGGYDYDYGYYGGGGGGGGGEGHYGGIASGPRKIRPDRLAGFGTINTRRSAPAEVTGKTAARTVTAPDKRTPAQGNPPVRQRSLLGEITRRIKDSESYVVTIPNDKSGRPVIQYRDKSSQPEYPKDIKISRQDDKLTDTPPTVSVNRRRIQDATQQRRTGDTNVTQSKNDAPDTQQNNEKAVNRSVTPQNNAPAERVDTSRSTTPSRDTVRTAPSYTPPSSGSSAPSSTPPSYTTPSRGGSTPSYTPRTGGGSSSGGQSRPSDSRSGQRRR